MTLHDNLISQAHAEEMRSMLRAIADRVDAHCQAPRGGKKEAAITGLYGEAVHVRDWLSKHDLRS